VIKVVKGEKDNLAEPANSVIKIKDRDVVKPAKKARLCLSGLARETFVPNKNDKSKIKFVQHINTAESNDDLALTLV
jgi:hypothetical protein